MEPFLKDILSGVSTMKGTRKSITDYDTVLSIAISTLQRRLARMENTLLDDDESVSSDDESVVNDISIKYKKGEMFDKFFPFYGWFAGEIIRISPNAEDNKIYLMQYEDGDEENVTEAELDQIIHEQNTIHIGDVGFKFIKKFGKGWYWATVIKELPNGKLLCKFNDNDVKTYTLKQVEEFAKTKNKGMHYS